MNTEHIDWSMIKGLIGAILMAASPLLDMEIVQTVLNIGEWAGRVLQGIGMIGGLYLLTLSIKDKRLSIRQRKQDLKGK